MTQKYYYMHEAAKEAGISTRTLYRWIKEGKILEAHRDRNNHRVFDKKMVETLKKYAFKITPAPHTLQGALFSEKK